MTRTWKLIFVAPLAMLAMLLLVALGGEVVMLLWNWLLPPLFGWHQIAFWQALGILVLCRLLFGGHGWHRSGGSNIRRRMGERMEERCGNMTPEERERFRQRMRERWGFAPSAGGESTGESKGQ